LHFKFELARFKVFLREDIWDSLVFTNKSHFGESRTLLLQWEEIDFFRLAYRLAIAGSAAFKDLSSRILPLTENQIDDATEDSLRQALAPLWGLRAQKGKNAYVTRWVYSRLTDASGNTYPRSLTILLNKAKEIELRASKRQTTSDRIFSWKSLTESLEFASKERCDAIRDEYPEFVGFFNHMNELGSLFKVDELRTIWETNYSDMPLDKSFDGFVKRLEQIGVIAQKKNNARYDYSVANLYVYGFGVKRKQGQQK
jgi:hypothetical protein